MNILVNACIQWLVVSSATVVLLCSTSYEEITTEQSTTVVSQESVRQVSRHFAKFTFQFVQFRLASIFCRRCIYLD